jgi:hypothetical protein
MGHTMKKKNEPGRNLRILAIAVTVMLLLPSGTRTQNLPDVPSADLSEVISSWNAHCNAAHSGAGSMNGGCTPAGKADVTVSAYYADGTGSVTVYQSAYSKIEQAKASVTSYFEVTGPANTRVPLVFYANAATSQSQSSDGGSWAFASAAVETGDKKSILFRIGACSHGFYDCLGTTATAGLPNAFSVQQSFTVSSNTLYAIVLDAVGYSNAGAFSAAVDPSVSFDPSFASKRSHYSLMFSGDASPVPH